MFELDTVVCGDCLDVMGDMPDNGIDTIITDPPWGINFMSRDWDHGVPGPRYWREALRVAKPGAFLLAFGGTRTWHRLACAIEDAGWEMKDTISWVYGSGFNKVGLWENKDSFKQAGIAEEFSGWGGSLKPAWEPVLMAMKPRDGTFANNAVTWGVAGLWIDGARIATSADDPNHRGATGGYRPEISKASVQNAPYNTTREATLTQGRWPSNFLLTHAPGCRRRGTRRVRGSHPIGPNPGRAIFGGINGSEGQPGEGFDYADPDGLETVDDWECEDGCPVAALAAQSGELRSGGHPDHPNRLKNSSEYRMTCYGEYGRHLSRSFSDAGTAARFFYQAKASRRERNLGCENVYWRKDKSASIGFVRIGKDEWEALPERERARGNIHPTVKPLGVVEYLCRLTRTPTGGVVFDPFLGTGTTALGAIRTGRRWLGCDNEPDYVYLANLRIEALRRETLQLELSL